MAGTTFDIKDFLSNEHANSYYLLYTSIFL